MATQLTKKEPKPAPVLAYGSIRGSKFGLDKLEGHLFGIFKPTQSNNLI